MPLQATSGAASYDAFGGGVPVVPAYIEEVFSTFLYTGNNSTQTITNNIDLSTNGGLVWLKARNNAQNNFISDTVIGRGASRSTNSTLADAAETLGSTGIQSFNSTGFTVNLYSNFGSGSEQAGINNSGNNMVSWTFRKQPKFFDVVTYTGDGTSSRGIAHALTSVPGMVIIKRTDSTGGWATLNRFDNTEYRIGSPGYSTPCGLNYTAALLAGNITTYASSTVFNVGSSLWGATETFNTNGATYVAYLFAHNAGGFGLTGTDNVISCGSFSTNASGVYSVNLGYEPQWVMIKVAGAEGNWHIQDNMRGMTTTTGPALQPNLSNAEGTAFDRISINSTGFFSNNTGGVIDGSATYIYIAIRRGPMKVPTVGTSVFYPTTYTGTGTARTFSGFGFPPDMELSFSRGGIAAGDGNGSEIYDKLRGPRVRLLTSASDAEYTTTESVTMLQDGISVGATTHSYINFNGYSKVLYGLKRAPSFFDEVCYTGSGSATTVTHNLGVVPELMIVKQRSAADFNWVVYSAATGNTAFLELNTAVASYSPFSGMWNNTTPTSSVFSLGTSGGVNASSVTYVAYLFATCAGVSKVGSYTGTATTLQIDCGFTGGARFVLIKRTDSTGGWFVWDSARGIVSGNDPYLLLNSTAAEVTSTDYIDTYSAGFEISSTAPAAINASGGTYIFLAIA